MSISWPKFASTVTILLAIGACTGTKRLEVEGSFPVPLMEKTPVSLGILLDEDLTSYVHTETIERKGTWEVSVGPAQVQLFNNLGSGVFEAYQFVESISETASDQPLDGTLKPLIKEVQFSLPTQTRSSYYEVWIRYEFQLYDRAGTLVGQWKLPAYGKANESNHGSASSGLQAAAMAACRDAMAFFSINFSREPVVAAWLAAGKPLMPPPPVPAPDLSAPELTPADTDPGQQSGTDEVDGGKAEPV
jgi:hypothetical protein